MRELVAFVKDGTEGDVNISMVSTPIAGDYKKLTSFGTMDTVMNTLVPNGKKSGVTSGWNKRSLSSCLEAYLLASCSSGMGISGMEVAAI